MTDSIIELTNFTEQQITFNSLFSSKVDSLLELTERVNYLESNILMLKSCVSKEVESLKSSYHLVMPAQKIILSCRVYLLKSNPAKNCGPFLLDTLNLEIS